MESLVVIKDSCKEFMTELRVKSCEDICQMKGGRSESVLGRGNRICKKLVRERVMYLRNF